MSKDEILTKLKGVNYPGLDTDIVALKVVKDINIDGQRIEVDINAGTDDPAKIEKLKAGIAQALSGYNVKINTDAGTTIRTQSDFKPEKSKPKGVKNVIAVSSGKGGVGKSTVAVNLAYSLKGLGKKIGILDLDFYGPNVPKIIGADAKPAAAEDDKIIPVTVDGIEVMSIGFLLKEEDPLIWRGPLITKAIEQFAFDTLWNELDFLILDLPPGTGDIQLTMAQKIQIAGALIVTTPQDVALIDVQKSINMFKKVEVPIIGVVENMSYFKCPNCGEITYIFKQGGGEKIHDKFGIDLLAQIPLDPHIAIDSDRGHAAVLSNDEELKRNFLKIAEHVISIF